jgi:bifunctional non-homologous end joining protein LigD
MSKTYELNGHTIEVDHLDKLYFPDAGITKGDLIDAYCRLADVMLPHMAGRPLSMERYPDGIGGGGFYQKEVPDYFPDWIEVAQIEVEEENASQPQVVCRDAATLVYLADQGMITPHIWLSRVDHLNRPDKLIFDLDPPENGFEIVRFAARKLYDIFDEVGMRPYVMTTGSKGLHVVLPLKPEADFDDARTFAHQLADTLAERYPDRLTTATRKNKREGRLFLDYLRNSYAQTSVTPYAVRALPGVPVATPLDWDEVDDPDLGPQSYTLANIFRRLGQKEDPWLGIYEHAVPLREAQQRLGRQAGG